MDLSTKTEVFNSDDQRWLGSSYGTDTPVSITLDISQFTEATHFADGWLKSGIALKQDGTTKLYGPLNGTSDIVKVFLLQPIKVYDRLTGQTSTKVAAAGLDHGKIKKSRLPHQTGVGSVIAADTNPHFLWV